MENEKNKPAISLSKNMLVNAVVLGLFAIVGTALVAYVNEITKDKVAENIRHHTLKKLHELIGPDIHNNDLDTDTIQVTNELLGKGEMTVYRARKNEKPVAAIIQCVAPDGYSGKIRLLVAVKVDGSLAGVRVTDHLETPGLGDAIESQKSDWIFIFDGKSLSNPPPEKWTVKRDSGDFDQITSATITSRAIVKASYKALQYFKLNRKLLFK